MDEVTVVKLNAAGEFAWQYQGQVLERCADRITLQAPFNRDDLPFFGIILARGDRFIETFFSDRWYNVFEIHDRVDNHVKGWYCNIAMPATLTDGKVTYIDLALDVLVYPDGSRKILDEDEFEVLEITAELREKARHALADVLRLVFSPFMFLKLPPCAGEEEAQRVDQDDLQQGGGEPAQSVPF